MKAALFFVRAALPVTLGAQAAVTLPELRIHSDRIAIQSPPATIAMPVSALRFEPRVDIQARNLAEGQADVTIRGGIFENTAFQIGAVTVVDPQTGHYFAELPVAPTMLTAPVVRTGHELVIGATNAAVGSIGYGWRPIRSAGMASIGVGEFNFRRAEIYQGAVTRPTGMGNGARFGFDVALAHAQSDGSVPNGEHEFSRANIRAQYIQAGAQTDLFAGYQGKRFGWPNLYTPFNSNETENLQTTLFAFNHRADHSGEDFLEIGAYHRRNKDDYAFNRFAPLGPVHPFQHTTWVSGIAGSGRRDLGPLAVNLRAEVLADELTSTSLTSGRYRTRTLTKLALVAERDWTVGDGSRTRVRAGVAHEDSNRDGGNLAPVFELAREFPAADLRRVSFGYTMASQLPTYTALNSSVGAGLFRGNPDLGRQKTHNVELGAAGAIAGWHTVGAIFYRREDSLVDWTFRQGVTARTANAVDMEVSGIELVARRSWAGCDFVIGYTGLTKTADYRGAPVDASFYALNYARHRLTAAATVRLGHGFELRMDNVIRFQAPNMLRTVGGDDAVLTAAGVFLRPNAWRGVEFSLYVDNLWDSDFQDVPAVPAAPRQFSAGVAYVW